MIRIFLVFFSFLIYGISFGQQNDSVKVTYIANSGYFIETGETNILIDAVFRECIGSYNCPDSSILDKMINGKEPFERIDFVLITHNHPDHVNDSLLVAMLNKRDDFTLILPNQVYFSIANQINKSKFRDRMHVIKLDTAEIVRPTINKMQFEIARSKHADTYDTENLCYMINDNGFKILHTGDSWPESLADIDPGFFTNIDLVIIPISFGKDRFVTHDSLISPRYTLISHLKADFTNKFKEIIKLDTATFGNKDVLFDPLDNISFSR